MGASQLDKAIKLSFLILCCLGITSVSIFFAYKMPANDGQTVAAWVQAVGSIVAILASGAIALHQAKVALDATVNAQKLQQDAKRQGIISVAKAAKDHADNMGHALSAADPNLALMAVYDKTIIVGMVDALSNAPLYEIGNERAVAAIVAIRDQFVFLGQAIEKFQAGPWRHEFIGDELRKYSGPQYQQIRDQIYAGTNAQLAKNVLNRVSSINKHYVAIESALSVYP